MRVSKIKSRYKKYIIDEKINKYRCGFKSITITFGERWQDIEEQIIFSISNKNTCLITKGFDEIYFGIDEKKVVDTLDSLLFIN